MAEEEKKEVEEQTAEQAAEGASRRKKGLYLGGGVLGLVVVAYMTALMAVPKKVETRGFEGPFVAALTEDQMQVNLASEGSRRYMVFALNAVYDAYDETYAAQRIADPLYLPLLQDALIEVAFQKTREQVMSLSENEVFKVEMRDAADPILFPVHIGEGKTPYAVDPESGLAPGESVYSATLRAPQHLHAVHVDAVAGTLQLDDGDVVPYDGTETDLELTSENGEVVHVDTTGIRDDFVGDVNVGVRGRIRQVKFSEFLVQ